MGNRFGKFEVWELLLIDQAIKKRIEFQTADKENIRESEIYINVGKHIETLKSIRNEIDDEIRSKK